MSRWTRGAPESAWILARRARIQALHEQHQVAPAEEGAVIFSGVDLWQLLPERALPECQFPVVQIGWRVDDDLQHAAVVRHDGHVVTTKIIEGVREGALGTLGMGIADLVARLKGGRP
jgi:hypothetical protein